MSYGFLCQIEIKLINKLKKTKFCEFYTGKSFINLMPAKFWILRVRNQVKAPRLVEHEKLECM